MTAITAVKSAKNREELREALASVMDLQTKHTILRNAIDSLNKEIESEIITRDTDSAIYKMSQVVMLEDEAHVMERIILMQGVVN